MKVYLDCQNAKLYIRLSGVDMNERTQRERDAHETEKESETLRKWISQVVCAHKLSCWIRTLDIQQSVS